ncbi:MAG: flagellar basal body P-ring protein FlgI [Myxococcota bacterium]
MLRLGFAAAALAVVCLLPGSAGAIRIKDISSVKGIRGNQIIGYGIVVGLNGTGDKKGTEFTVRSLTSLLAKMGIGVDPEDVKVKNVAAVMLTSMLPPFARIGSRLDAVVSSLGDATSLEGGTLLMTPMFGTDNRVYAIAQGPISVGGFSVGGGGGSSIQKNHPTVGRVANGATVERELDFVIEGRAEFDVNLSSPDFTTARRAKTAINQHFGSPVAEALDSGTLRLTVPESHADDVVAFMAEVEAVDVEPDRRARVVLNERTGTVVMGADVRISTVAVSHGNLSVTIGVSRQVSQPQPFGSGETTVVENTFPEVVEQSGNLSLVDGSVSIAELIQGLNSMGVTPRDLIAILQAIKASGALSADLELM